MREDMGTPNDSGYGYSGDDDRAGRAPRAEGARPRAQRSDATNHRSSRGAQPTPTGVAGVLGKAADVARSAVGAVSGAAGSVASRVRGGESDARGARVRTASERSGVPYGGEPMSGSSSRDYLGTGNPCVRCGKPVDPSEPRCPHCGALQKPFYTNPVFLVPIVVLLALVIVLTIAINSCAGKTSGPTSGTSTVTPASDELKSQLASKISEAQQYLSDNTSLHIYTAATASDLETATAKAVSVNNSSSAGEEDVTNAINAITDAENALVQVGSFNTVEWPWYDPLMQSIDSYVGTQIAMTGTIVSSTDGTNGRTILINISGDATCPLVLTVNSLTTTDVTSPTAGTEVSLLGTVTGTTQVTGDDGTERTAPTVTADFLYAVTDDAGAADAGDADAAA